MMSHRIEIRFWDPDVLQAELPTRQLGRPLHVFNRLTSTNEFAKRLARRGANAGTLVLADSQSAGRGRHGRRWHSPPGKGLWFSFILRPRAQAVELGLLPLLTAAVLVEQLAEFLKRPFQVKWPNDVLAEGKKICGILCEAQFTPPAVDFVVVGIGVNVNQTATEFPPALQSRAQSLAMTLDRPVDRKALFLALLQGLDHAFLAGEQLPVAKLAVWKAACADIGRAITLWRGERKIAGVFEDVSDRGELVLRSSDGIRHFAAAEFSMPAKPWPAASADAPWWPPCRCLEAVNPYDRE